MRALAAVGVEVEPLAEPLGRMCVLADDLELAREAWLAAGCPLVSPGATGQDRPHPLLGVMRDHRREILELERELGLTRTLRGRGRPPGAASAPDRAAPPRRTLKAVDSEARSA